MNKKYLLDINAIDKETYRVDEINMTDVIALIADISQRAQGPLQAIALLSVIIGFISQSEDISDEMVKPTVEDNIAMGQKQAAAFFNEDKKEH